MKAIRPPPGLEHRRVVARLEPPVAEGGEEHAFQQLVHEPAAAAVRQQHLRVLVDRSRAGHRDVVRLAHLRFVITHSSILHSSLRPVREPPVPVVGRAGPFRRDHRRTERVLGRAASPNAAHSFGFFSPCRTRPAMHSAGSGRGPTSLRSKRRSASNAAYSSRRPRPLPGISPMPRHARCTTWNTSGHQRLRRLVARLGDHARVLVLDLGPALFQLLQAEVDALQQVERLEAGDDDRHAVALGDRHVLRVAHHRADVSGGEEPLHAARRRGEDRLERGRHEHVRDEDAEVGDPVAPRLVHRHRVGRRGRLEADGEEHHLPARVVARRWRARRAASRRCARRRRRP